MSAKANQSGGAKLGYIGGESRNQRYLLPEAIDDYINRWDRSPPGGRVTSGEIPGILAARGARLARTIHPNRQAGLSLCRRCGIDPHSGILTEDWTRLNSLLLLIRLIRLLAYFRSRLSADVGSGEKNFLQRGKVRLLSRLNFSQLRIATLWCSNCELTSSNSMGSLLEGERN